jgi:predicted Rossmann-fold nucleotide-binding protein
VKQTRGRVVEVDSLADFDRRIAEGAPAPGLAPARAGPARPLGGPPRRRRRSALFLGCRLAAGDEIAVRASGAVVYPEAPAAPHPPHGPTLYTPRELYDTPDYDDSLDSHMYAWSRREPDQDAALAQALHDHDIDVALEAWLAERSLVGVMGGHRPLRGSGGYAEAARLGHALGSSYAVATGGGPGAMEAANLGAALSGRSVEDLEVALEILGRVPSYRPDVGAWVAAAFEVLDRFPDPTDSLGIPIWHYGHQPTNPFATAIAKYFRNATREAILLEVCRAGIVFLPGAGGTVQEIFRTPARTTTPTSPRPRP